jgi:hypothetical protein
LKFGKGRISGGLRKGRHEENEVQRMPWFDSAVLATGLNLHAQTWTYTGNMINRHADHTATLLPNGNVLVAAGRYKGHYGITKAEVYNPSTGTFSTTGNLNTGRYYHTATLLPNGEVLIVGGSLGVYSPTGSYTECLAGAELYNPSTGTFTLSGSLQTARCGGFTATLLNSGLVLIVGGTNISGTVSIAELYNPATGTFSATGSPQVARWGLTAALLPNGEVLIAGGCGSSSCFTSAELYNPASGTFTLTGSMKTPRALFTSTLLPNGEVLAAAGENSQTYRLTSAELYNPSTGKWSP